MSAGVQTSGRLAELLPVIRRVREEGELRALEQAAAADGHQVVAATHLVMRGKEIVGYGSIGGLMLLNVWVRSGRVRARESAYCLNLAECVAASEGARGVVVPCAEESPFAPYMGALGYRKLGLATWNVKVL